MRSCRTDTHTAQMVAFEVINTRECTITDVTSEVLVCRLHGGPPGRRGISGVRRERIEAVGERVRYWYYSMVCREEVHFGLW